MSPSAPARPRQSFRHEAFLWRDPADFVQSMVPFVEQGLADDEPVMVALVPEHAAWLRDALGRGAVRVQFFDMRELGRNPAQIIPAWRAFLDRRSGPGFAYPLRVFMGSPLAPTSVMINIDRQGIIGHAIHGL